MECFRIYCWIIYLIWNTLFQGIILAPQWGKQCPKECQCTTSDLSQTLISQWQHQRRHTKTAVCVFPLHSLHNMLMIPYDTESFTFIQGTDNSNTILNGDMTRTLQNLQSMDIQGMLSTSKLPISDTIFLGMMELMYLSLQRVDLTGATKAFAKLHSLEILQVINCDVPYLKWEMLNGLSKLRELYIVQSGLKEIYDFAFYGTPELRKLFLSHNELFSLTADALVGLLKLEHLDLSNNRIDHLSALTFPPMPSLQWLDMKHNPIRVIFPHCFQFLNKIQHLTLGHKLQSVHLVKFSFRGLSSLVFLHIPNIDNDILNEHMFYNLQSLMHMNLQGRIKMINNQAFNGAHKVLQKLILHKCKLEKILDNAFHFLNKLTTLDLSSNLLEYLPNGVFEPLEALKELILSGNLFKSLQNDIFISLNNLQALRLDANPWTCTCNMSSWDVEIVSKMSQVVPLSCKNKSNPLCEEYDTSYNVDRSLIPKCEMPIKYRGEDVFEVLEKSLKCKQN